MTELPKAFADRMRAQLGAEYDQYLESFDRNVFQGMRVNTLKITPGELAEKMRFVPEPVLWCPEGLYADENLKPSRHPYYYAGLYYLQEPSAMAPGAYLPVEPGDRVLDLCAAPGGKSTQLACKLNGTGVLVSNDISISRTRALLKNLELFGAGNICITSEAPYKLAERFPGYFSKILVDAPCSGEGMFHKEPQIMKNWEQYGTGYYAKLQAEILDAAAGMLSPGGMLLYSTCTFSPDEDEGQIDTFLKKHASFHLVPLTGPEGADHGHPEWVRNGRAELEYCMRLWPHRIRGEGHFLALMRKDGVPVRVQEPESVPRLPEAAEAWWKQSLHCAVPMGTELSLRGESLLLAKIPEEKLKGIRLIRNGLLLGELKKNRFEPSQALAMSLAAKDAYNPVILDPQTALHYLKGESLQGDYGKDWHLVTVDGFPLGWGKGSGSLLKNKYLKGWRYL